MKRPAARQTKGKSGIVYQPKCHVPEPTAMAIK
jgi:hypothetical protein